MFSYTALLSVIHPINKLNHLLKHCPIKLNWCTRCTILTLRTVQNKSRFSDVKQLYISYNILPVQLLYKLNIAKIVYKCLHCKETVSIVMYEIFNKNCFNHSVNTRLCSTKYLYLQANSSIFKSLIYLATLLWNSIPINIRQSPTVNTFSMSYRNYILENWK